MTNIKTSTLHGLQISELLDGEDTITALAQAEGVMIIPPGEFAPAYQVKVENGAATYYKYRDKPDLTQISNELPLDNLKEDVWYLFNNHDRVLSARLANVEQGVSLEYLAEILPQNIKAFDGRYFTEKLPLAEYLVGLDGSYIGLYLDDDTPYRCVLSTRLKFCITMILLETNDFQWITALEESFQEIAYWKTVLRHSRAIFNALEGIRVSQVTMNTLRKLAAKGVT